MLKSPLAIIMYLITVVVIGYFAILFGFSPWTAGFLALIICAYIAGIIALLKDD